MAIEIERKEPTAADLRRLARRARSPAQARRMLALALVLDGSDRTTAAQSCGMDRQTLRDWVHRYNAEGSPGGRPTAAGAAGTPLAGAGRRARGDRRGRSRRRGGRGGALALRRPRGGGREALRGRAARAHGRAHPERRATRGSRRARNIRRPTSRPGGFQKNFPAAVAAALPDAARASRSRSRFQDEARVGQQGTITRVWARRGTRPARPRHPLPMGLPLRRGLPERGGGAGLVMPRADTTAMNAHLAEISATVAPDAHAVLVLDGAGWHVAALSWSRRTSLS